MAQDLDDFIQSINRRGKTDPVASSGGNNKPAGASDLNDFMKSIRDRGGAGPAKPSWQSDDTPSDSSDEGLLSTPITSAGRFVKGVGKGLAGDVVGAGQVARGIESGLFGTHALRRIGEMGPARAISDYASTPSESSAESIGNFIGAAAPALVPVDWIPGGAVVASRAWPIVRGAAQGAFAGGVQPTAEGTASSHIPGAVAGGALGAVPSMGVGGLHLAASALRMMGVPIPHTLGLLHSLSQLASGRATGQTLNNLAQQARRIEDMIKASRTIGGAVAGQTLGQGTYNLSGGSSAPQYEEDTGR
jgi:hypothetical protein